MSDIIIKAEHVGKSYFIGHQRQRGYIALRDVLAQKAKGIAKSIKDVVTGKQLIDGQEIEEFWALNDVSFEVKQGDAVGIIGSNGAGKSTLLKVLSRITEPTKGRITLNGRVASLLEVGTGFHPELTGRENIYLNGAILGMSRAEIKRKFDEIIDFSGVEKFLDTPVKRYSSGMYVRLAFSVAAHLEPEILIIDEVLAVGDVEFQKKCLGKMDDVSKKEGRTVLLVSHHMGSIAQLCRKVLILDKGNVLEYTDNVMQGVEKYLKLNKGVKNFENKNTDQGLITVNKITLSNNKGESVNEFSIKDEIHIDFEFDFEKLPPNISLFVTIQNQHNMPVFSDEQNITLRNLRLKILPDFLVQGMYSLIVIIHQVPNEQYFKAEHICPFNIFDTDSKFIIYNNYSYNYGSVFGKTSWE